MKRSILLLAVLGLGLSACSDLQSKEDLGVVDGGVVEITNIEEVITGNDMIKLLYSDKSEIDINSLSKSLNNKAFEQLFYLDKSGLLDVSEINDYLEEGKHATKDVKFVFDKNGYGRQYRRVALDNNHRNSDKAYDYYQSQNLKWDYNSSDNTITMEDEYGNKSTAIVKYFDGKYMCYEGALGREAQSLYFNADVNGGAHRDYMLGCLMVVDDRDCWDCETPKSMEVMLFNFVDENDEYAKLIESIENSDNDIDDLCFVDIMCKSAINLTADEQNMENCQYGRKYVYSVKDGFMIYSGANNIYNNLMIFMDDNTVRCCSTFGEFSIWGSLNEEYKDLYGSNEKVYVVNEWSYKADTNTINTYNDKLSAEVVYFDRDIAILKGYLFHGELTNGIKCDYNYYIFDFNREDRAKVMEEYPTDITEYI